MKAQTIQLHNFRSIQDLTVALDDYSLLVGENNTGKTAILSAIRAFYEEGGTKFSHDVDFPKFPTDDSESWVEITYQTSEEEQATLKAEYRSADNILRVRRYFQSDNKDLVKANQSNIYGYEKGTLSSSLFYGAKNVSQAKLGSVLYIPEVNRSDDALKLSGPSPFRDMVNFVMKRAVLDSRSFGDLQGAFTTFNERFKKEASADGFSVGNLIEDINREVAHWRIRFGVDVNPLRPEDIVKTLLTHYIEDDNLEGKRVALGSYGQGLQRHLIYTLVRLSARFVEPRSEKKKEFAPDLTLILFEEPEAFLHPSQQQRLNGSLRALAAEPTQQVLITTHSPQFVSKQVCQLRSIIRLQKRTAVTERFQLSEHQGYLLPCAVGHVPCCGRDRLMRQTVRSGGPPVRLNGADLRRELRGRHRGKGNRRPFGRIADRRSRSCRCRWRSVQAARRCPQEGERACHPQWEMDCFAARTPWRVLARRAGFRAGWTAERRPFLA